MSVCRVMGVIGACSRAAALVALLLVLTGCVSGPETGMTGTGEAPVAGTVSDDSGSTETGATEPIVSGNADGLEVHWWLADDSGGAIGAALAPYAADLQPEDRVTRTRWESSGLRLVRVPVDRWAAVAPLLVPLHQRTRDWIGWAPQWREVFRGRRVGGEQPVVIEGERTNPERSLLRVLLRAWPAPPADPAVRRPEVRAEIAFQLLPPDTTRRDPFARPKIVPPEEEGTILRRLTMQSALDPGYVYVLTAEAPGVTWESRSDFPVEPSPASDEEADSSMEELIAGPPSSGPRTLGEAGLGASAAETKNRPAKAVIVFVPRVPSAYQLLP